MEGMPPQSSPPFTVRRDGRTQESLTAGGGGLLMDDQALSRGLSHGELSLEKKNVPVPFYSSPICVRKAGLTFHRTPSSVLTVAVWRWMRSMVPV